MQPPALWIIDLNTDRVLRRFEFPAGLVQIGRGLASVTVDVEAGQCADAFAYMPDLVSNAVFTYE